MTLGTHAEKPSLAQIHPAELAQIIAKRLAGSDWLYWDPLALLVTIGAQAAVDVDKIAAIQALVRSPVLVTQDYAAFEKVAHAFCHNPVLPEVDQPLSLEEAFYSVRQIQSILRAFGVDAPFSGEVPPYIAVVATEEGWEALPRELSFSQEMFNSLSSMVSRHNEESARDSLSTVAGMSRESMLRLLEQIAKDTSQAARQLRQYIGLYLYDPTLQCAS